jgi:PAS domain S-box-containing protein
VTSHTGEGAPSPPPPAQDREVLHALKEGAPDGIIVVSPEGRIVTWNARFQAIWDLPDDVIETGSDDAALQCVLDRLVDPAAFVARVRALYDDPVPARDELRLRDGRLLERFGVPLRESASDRSLGYAWFVRDITAERQERDTVLANEVRYRSLVRALSTEVWRMSVTGELIGDLPVWRSVTGQSREQLAGLGWLDAVHPDDRERVRRTWKEAVHSSGSYDTEYRICPVDGSDDERVLSVRGVPMTRDGMVSEWVGVYSDVTEIRNAEKAREQLSVLVARTAERTRALQEVTAALSSAVTMSDVFAVILDKGQATLGASGSGVALRHGNRMHYEVLQGYTADVKAAWADFPIEESLPVTHVMRTREPIFVESADELLDFYGNDRLRAFVQATGERAWTRLPLITPTAILGVLMFGFDAPRRFSENDRAFALALAGQCAQAIERAQLYERQRNNARLLQRSLLPEALPAVPGVTLSALCQPASADNEVSGDWYDALTLPDGRLALVVGDVVGKGVRAASVLGQVRNALRGLLHVDTSPAAVLGWLDELVRHLGNDEEFVTLVYGIFDPSTGTFDWASAGHLPPLVIGPDEARLVQDGGTRPLGLDVRPVMARLVLEPGSALMLYSDGLVESRRRPVTVGLEQLVARAEELLCRGRLPDADGIRAALTDGMTDPSADDDVTVLVLRRAAASASPERTRSADTVLPGRATSARLARAFVADRLVEWDLEDLADAVLLCVSEIDTNAVVHAGSYAELSMQLAGRVLRVEVRDAGGGEITRTRRLATTEDTHGRGLLLVEALSDRWGTAEEGERKVVWFELVKRD